MAKEIKYVLLKDVVIKAGTVLDRACNERGGEYNVEAFVEMGKDSNAVFNMSIGAIEDAPEDLITKLK